MRTLLAITLLGAAVAGCGSSNEKPAATTTPGRTATPQPVATADLSGYSEGVRTFYAGIPAQPPDDPEAATEAEYFQPPKPAQARLGETITLTGSNIGVRLRVTVTGVERTGSHTAVHLHLVNDGIAVYDAPLENATLAYADGKPLAVAHGAKAKCSARMLPTLRLDVSRSADGCLLFPAKGDETPQRVQIALETVPAAAGGIWNLDAR